MSHLRSLTVRRSFAAFVAIATIMGLASVTSAATRTVSVTSITTDYGGGAIPLSSTAGIASSNFNDVKVDFTLSAPATFSVRFGPDFGFGGYLLIDGNVVDVKWYDLWWNFSWADPSQILTATLALPAGNHTIEAVGWEGCCFGEMQAEWQIGETGWNVFTIGSTTVVTPPSNMEECKKGGWLGFLYKNQGDCVSFFATKGKNGPAF